MRQPRFITLHRPAADHLADEARRGLLHQPATVSPKFLYDPLGSHLFDAITVLDEYYPTRTEAAILAAHQADIAAAVQAALPGRQAGDTAAGLTLVDLGAGDGAKAARLFSALQVSRYVAVDISVDFLQRSLQALQRQHPTLDMVGLGQDFAADLHLPPGLVDGPSLVFYPGSSIGNFSPDEALHLLTQARAVAAGGALLIGVDLVKPASVLEAAYDDALGVTAAFNLNLLRHLNRLIGSDFDPRQWRHLALYNAAQSRIEMHLAARQALSVTWPGGQRRFAADERLHTENSYKWTLPGFDALLRDAGFQRLQHWTDAQGWFGVVLASG